MDTENTMTCVVCGETKPLNKFSTSKQARNGRCQPCRRCWNKRYRDRDPDTKKKRNALDRARYAKQKAEGWSEKKKARDLLRDAVHKGRIRKPTRCEKCGGEFPKNEIEGHHEDYLKPYFVEWLCHPCHQRSHEKDDLPATE
jgi:hypothetical protein